MRIRAGVYKPPFPDQEHVRVVEITETGPDAFLTAPTFDDGQRPVSGPFNSAATRGYLALLGVWDPERMALEGKA